MATTFVTSSFENPLALPAPRLRGVERVRFGALLKNLNQGNRDPSLEDRLHLSCRWDWLERVPPAVESRRRQLPFQTCTSACQPQKAGPSLM